MGRAEEEKDVRELLLLAVRTLADSMVPSLLPGVGFRIVYALRGARRQEDVAGVEGGLVREGGKVRPAGGIAFGAGEGVAGMVLTAMHTDPEIRSAAAIRFSPAIHGILGDLLLEVCEFDRAREP
ncbi:MAG TPA: thiamine-phosphate synthase family protein, partial [Methanomicrobiales archaeon]|nr:thiamine-phosphate synthase family protein [Methanomicrobiales archaeon]